MRKSQMDRMTTIVAAALAGFAIAAVMVGPAFSADRDATAVIEADKGAEPAKLEVERAPGDTPAHAATTPQPAEARADADAEGYEWSGNRRPADRYLWSHRPG